MALLVLCGALRVALVTAYLTLALAKPDAAAMLMVPFAAVVLAVTIYDACDSYGRSR